MDENNEGVDLNETKSLITEEEKSQGNDYLPVLKGIGAGFGAVLVYTAAATCVQLLERRIPDFELNVFRSVVTLLCCSVYLWIIRQLPLIERNQIVPALLYMGSIFINSFAAFVSISFIAASWACSLHYGTTVVTSLIIFPLVGREKISIKKIVFAFICIAGVLMVTQPAFNLGNSNHSLLTTQTENSSTRNGGDIFPENDILNQSADDVLRLWNGSQEGADRKLDKTNVMNSKITMDLVIGYLSPVIGGTFLTLNFLVLKRYPCIAEKIAEFLFWTFSGQTLISIMMMMILETPVLPSNWFDTTMVIVHSLACPAIYVLYIYGPKYISGITFAIIVTTDVVFMLLAHYTVLSSILPGHRNWMEVAGVVLVLLGCSMSSILEMINSKSNGE